MAPLEGPTPPAPLAARAASLALDGGDGADEEEVHYAAHRAELLELLRAGGPGGHYRLDPRGEGGVGLQNQGATCYMNSLLQALFYTPEFRQLLYNWSYSAAAHGEAARSIPLQLQRLFAQLQLTRATAISTRPLTAAFGFSDSASREQHDVQELCRVLLDALGRSAQALSEGIDRLYAGSMVYYVRSCEAAEGGGPAPESRRDEKFLDLQVPIQGCKTLEEALQRLVEPEHLEGDNRWYCEGLGKKVDALKGVEFGKLPRLLCLQLLRFVFDIERMQRRKLTEALSIPLEMDLSFMLSGSGVAAAEPMPYELTAVCCHSGTAHGGHYHALLRSSGKAAWRDANDSHVRMLGEDQEQRLFPPREFKSGSTGSASAPQQDGEVAGGSELAGNTLRALASSDAYFLIYRFKGMEPPEVPDSGVPEPHRSELLAENARLEALQRAYRVHRQLMEVRVFAPTAAQLALHRYVAQQLRGLLSEEEELQAGKLEPQSLLMSVRDGRKVAEVRQHAVASFIEDAEKGGEPWPWSMGLSLDERSKGGGLGGPSTSTTRFRGFDARTGEVLAPLEEGLPLLDALRQAGVSAAPQANLLLEARVPGDEFQAWEGIAVRVLVCRWDPQSSALSLQKPRDLVALRLPLLASSPTSEPAPEAPPEAEKEAEGPAAEPDAVDDEGLPDLFGDAPVGPVPRAEDRTPRVAALRSAAAQALGLPPSQRFALVPLNGPHAGEELREEAASLLRALRDGYGSLDGSDIICVEPVEEGEPVTLQSVALYARVRNTAHLCFNHPDRPEYTEELEVSISKDATLLELKTKVAEMVGLEAEKLHLARAHKAPQLKDESKTLRVAGLAESSHCHIGHGAPCGVDGFMLRVSLHSPADKGGGGAGGAAGSGKASKEAFTHAVKASSSIRSLRQALAEPLCAWAAECRASDPDCGVPELGPSLPWQRLRLRDGQAGKQLAVLRDERTVRAALLGLADGRQVAVQVLDHEEELTPEDLILQLRPWRYAEGKLHAPLEMVVQRSMSVGELREKLTARFHALLEHKEPTAACEEDEEGGKVASAVAEPPLEQSANTEAVTESKEEEGDDRLDIVSVVSLTLPLSIKRCAAMRWGESQLNASSPDELRRPLSEVRDLRDGSTLILRSARQAMRGPPTEPAAPTGKAGGKGPKAGTAVTAKAKSKAGAAAKGKAKIAGIATASRGERALVIEVAHPEGSGAAAAQGGPAPGPAADGAAGPPPGSGAAPVAEQAEGP